MTTPRILCSATVEPVNGHSPDTWVVTVKGELPYGETRVYTIAGEKNASAMKGIDRFVAEMTDKYSVATDGAA